MYNPKSLKAEEFISDEEIRETLAYADANKENMELIPLIPYYFHVMKKYKNKSQVQAVED